MGTTRLLVGLALIGLIYLLAQYVWEQVQDVPAGVILSGHTRPKIEAMVKEEAFTVIGGTNAESHDITVDTQFADLDNDNDADLIATLRSNITCGNAGCVSFIFMQNEAGQFERTTFNYAADTVNVLQSITNGMRDIEIKNKDTYRLTWNGTHYEPDVSNIEIE